MIVKLDRESTCATYWPTMISFESQENAKFFHVKRTQDSKTFLSSWDTITKWYGKDNEYVFNWKNKMSLVEWWTIKRSTRASLEGKAPVEVWTDNPIDIDNLRIFRCSAYVHISSEDRYPNFIKSRRSVASSFTQKVWMDSSCEIQIKWRWYLIEMLFLMRS